MLSIRAYGTLEILDNARKITINYGSGQQNISEIGVVTYSSKNGYFLDQSYTYEAGAMIVSQAEGNLMMIRPSFFIEYDSIDHILNISLDMVNISSVGQKTIASGFGTYPLQTEFHSIGSNTTFTNVRNITLKTPLSNAWAVFMDSWLLSSLNEDEYDITDTGQAVILDDFSSVTVNVFLRIIDIRAQIGPGWVEQQD
jgi:hypothetical protein